MTPTLPDAIHIEQLSFSYPDGRKALKKLSFTVKPDERVALVGPNGSGKSTLLLHLNGILRAQTGHIRIFGQSLNDTSLSQIRAWVGLLFQNPDDQLFSTRVYDDVAFSARYRGMSEQAIEQHVTNALGMVNMQDYQDRIPYHLSVGEKKRIALATLLGLDTKILALDEPSAGLDPRARRDLITLLKPLPNHTMLISTHDMKLAAALCTRVILLDEGEIVADGSSEAILYQQALMEKHGLETP